jgi:hypothetical protein
MTASAVSQNLVSYVFLPVLIRYKCPLLCIAPLLEMTFPNLVIPTMVGSILPLTLHQAPSGQLVASPTLPLRIQLAWSSSQ